MGSLANFVVYVVLAAVALQAFFAYQRRLQIPPHLTGHVIEAIPNFLSPQVGDELMELIKKMKTFPSNANDVQVRRF